jgi:hypothetical protein
MPTQQVLSERDQTEGEIKMYWAAFHHSMHAISQALMFYREHMPIVIQADERIGDIPESCDLQERKA